MSICSEALVYEILVADNIQQVIQHSNITIPLSCFLSIFSAAWLFVREIYSNLNKTLSFTWIKKETSFEKFEKILSEVVFFDRV